MPGRRPQSSSKPDQQPQSPSNQPRGRGARNKEEWGIANGGSGAEEKEAYDHDDGAYPEDDDGADVSEADLRARQQAQRKHLQQQATSSAAAGEPSSTSSLHPSYPPPQRIMNPEEDDRSRSHLGQGNNGTTGAGADEAGYWSDPEVAPVATAAAAAAASAGGAHNRGRGKPNLNRPNSTRGPEPHSQFQQGGGSGGGRAGKQKQDPRTTQAVSAAAQFSRTGPYRNTGSVQHGGSSHSLNRLMDAHSRSIA